MTVQVAVVTDGVFLNVREQSEGQAPHRRVIDPGHFEGDVWVPTDLTGEPQEVQDAAAQAWIPAAVAAWRTLCESRLPPPPSTHPADFTLTMRQLRLGLKELAGKSASFLLDTINAIPDPDDRDRALIWYEETSVVDWNHPMTQALIGLAGFTPEQAAAMWMVAKDIPA